MDFIACTVQIEEKLTSGEGIRSGDADEEHQSSIHSVVEFDEKIVGRRRLFGGRRVFQGL
jgi:hypothetical protein